MQHRSSYRLSLLIALGIHLVLMLVLYLLLNPIQLTQPDQQNEKRYEVSFHTFSSSNEAEPSPLPSNQHTAPAVPQERKGLEEKKGNLPTVSKKNQGLSSSENTPSISTIELLNQPENIRLREAIKRHYGDEFFLLSAAQQNYIITNLQKIRRINDIVGNRLLQTKPQENLENRDNNYVEFYLHPDGSISDVMLQNERSDSLLDELTYETIQLAHTEYPKPKETTLIRIRVWIIQK